MSWAWGRPDWPRCPGLRQRSPGCRNGSGAWRGRGSPARRTQQGTSEPSHNPPCSPRAASPLPSEPVGGSRFLCKNYFRNSAAKSESGAATITRCSSTDSIPICNGSLSRSQIALSFDSNCALKKCVCGRERERDPGCQHAGKRPADRLHYDRTSQYSRGGASRRPNWHASA